MEQCPCTTSGPWEPLRRCWRARLPRAPPAQESQGPKVLEASDPASDVGKRYGAFRKTGDGGLIYNRTLFIIDGEGLVAWRAVPFREVDPKAYVELREASDRIAPVTGEAEMQ